MKSILIVAPHGDDEVLGTCGAILHHVRDGHNVTVVFVTGSYDPRTEAQLNTTTIVQRVLCYNDLIHLNIDKVQMSVDLISKLDKIIESIKPDIMYSPWIGDLHQDHRVIAEACSSASRIGNRFFIKNVFCYEVPSSTDQGFMRSVNPFIPNYYLRLNEGDVDMKVNMMLEYGAEQSSLRSPGAIRELAKKRGRECESIFAESFMCMRRVDE